MKCGHLMIEATNLGALFDAERGGDNLAIIDCLDWQAPRRYSHREIENLANACARSLVGQNLSPGEAVAILSANRVEFLISYLAILRAGMIAVPISNNFSNDVVEFILDDATVKHVICDRLRRQNLSTDLPITMLDGPGLDGPGLDAPGVVAPGVDAPGVDAPGLDAPGGEGFQALLDFGEFETRHPGDDDVAMVLYTSGSTGRPKGVPLTHKGHLWALKARMAKWPFDHHRLLVAAPLYHMNALCSTLFGLAASTSTVLLPEFHARRYLQAIDKFDCTWITAVPTMLAMAFMEKDLLERLDFSSVTVVRMGSAPISPKLWDTVKSTFPGASVMNSYGTTESGPIAFGPAGDKPLPDMSVGRQMPGAEIKLVDANGQEAMEGVLWHRCPAVMTGYLNFPEKTAEVLTDYGWYITGDVFRREDDCYYFVGRSDDMFVCGGENIYPGEVESLLVSHPEIDQSCIVPVPDEIKGEKPVAFVVRQSGSSLSAETVKQHALSNAPAYQHPRMVIFMDELPLAGPGKVDRASLKGQALKLWQAESAEIQSDHGGDNESSGDHRTWRPRVDQDRHRFSRP